MKKVPKATVKRLPFYRRCFEQLRKEGVTRVLSSEVGQILKIDPATIRRDFSYIGELGRQGYGYDVNTVLAALNTFLDLENTIKGIIIGVGNLGKAFLDYILTRTEKNELTPIKFVGGFDIDPNVVGTKVHGVEILHVDHLEDVIHREKVKVAVLSVPTDEANPIAKRLEAAGIIGIFNFSSTSLAVSKDVYVYDVDLLNELQSFLFFVKNEYSS